MWAGLWSAPIYGQAQEPSTDTMPTVELSLVPQPEPDPPLQYRLVPAYSEIRSGNAAIRYYRAILLMPREKEKVYSDEQANWLDQPLSQFPQDAALAFLEPYRNTFLELKSATRCDHCNWDLPVREMTGIEAISLLLPDMQETRALARVLRIKTRLEISQRQYDAAIESMTMSYRLATDVSKSPLLISNLVAAALAGITNQSVQDWIESGGPNLYWALAGLPTPVVDLRQALEQEMNLPLQTFPILKDPEHARYTPDQWRQQIAESVQRLSQFNDGPRAGSSDLVAQSAATALIFAGYGPAKQGLIDSGLDPAEVEAMPVGQVVAIATARSYRKVYQESMKWTYLPYWQSYRQMGNSFQALTQEGHLSGSGGLPGVIPIAAMFLPAIESATFAPVRVQRELDALRAIEAIRAAASSGQGLPDSLSAENHWPVPIDPVTGHSLIYRREGDRAILELPPPEGKSASHFGKQYILRISDQPAH